MRQGKALLVRRGGAEPGISVTTLPQPAPQAGEVVVRVQAAAFTPIDALLCGGLGRPLPPPLESLFAVAAPPQQTRAANRVAAQQDSQQPGQLELQHEQHLVPGFFFCGEVLELGAFVEGIRIGEPVIGLTSGPLSSGGSSAEDTSADQVFAWGCYREAVCVHFSTLLPIGDLQAAAQMPSLVAFVPPMVSALCCVASHLRLRPAESLLIVAPHLGDIIFILQRLLLTSDAWRGPLYVVVLHGRAPTRTDLEHHPLLRPLVVPAAGFRPTPTFLDDVTAWSVEEHLQQRLGDKVQPARVVKEALKETIAAVLDTTKGVGVDCLCALDVDLRPPPPSEDVLALLEERTPAPAVVGEATGQSSHAVGGASSGQGRPTTTLLRALIGCLALRGRLVTNWRRLEVMPSEGEHLWAKEASISFFNPHCSPLSGAQHGAMLHAMTEVISRIARSELPAPESEVVQYRLFEQFHTALAAAGDGRTDEGSAISVSRQLSVLLV